jgi:hypothetical protein
MASTVHIPLSVSVSDLDQAVADLGEAVTAFKAKTTEPLLQSHVFEKARQIVNMTQIPGDQWLWQSVNMTEYAAIRTYMKWEAFDKIPAEGSISYKQLAEKCDATEALTSKTR